MRLWIGAVALAVAGLAATPGYAGIGQCVWEHLPQAERDRAFAAPSGLPLKYQEFVAGLDSAIPAADSAAAMTACAGAAANGNNNAETAVAGYIVQHWAEHWLFLYAPHLSTDQLDRAYHAVDPNLTSRIGVSEIANQSAAADVAAALPAFKQALGQIGDLTPESEAALGIYLAGRAGREAAEALYGH